MPLAPGKSFITEASIKDIFDDNYRAQFRSDYQGYAEAVGFPSMTEPQVDRYLDALLAQMMEADPLTPEGTDPSTVSPSPNLRQIFVWVLWLMDRERKAKSYMSPMAVVTALQSRYPIREMLEEFYDIRKVLPPELRAINRFKTPLDLQAFLETEGAAYSKQAEAELVAKESSVFYEDAEWQVLIPKSHKASCHFGNNTEWCTADPRSSNYFNQYTNHGVLLMCMNKADEGNSIQIFIPREGEDPKAWKVEIRDDEDRTIWERDVSGLLPNELVMKIAEKFGIDFSAEPKSEIDRLYRGLTTE